MCSEPSILPEQRSGRIPVSRDILPREGAEEKKYKEVDMSVSVRQLRQLVRAHVAPQHQRAFWKGASSMGQVPNRVAVKLRYSEVFNNGAVATFTSNYNYRSSLHDPNLSGAGFQPNGFDQWMAFYNNFLVTRVRLVTEWFSSDHSAAVVVQPSVQGTTTSIAQMLGNPRTRSAIYSIGGPPARVDTGWISLPDFFGVSIEEMRAEARFWGTASSSPTEYLVLSITSATLDGGLTYHESQIVLLEFEAEFFDRVTLALS